MKKKEIVVFGATGFSGQFVAQFLAEKYEVPFAISGRSEIKLKAVQKQLEEKFKKKIPIITASIEDEKSLLDICSSTKILINCVGPFEKFGEIVVKTCIETGCHYLDINGEPSFIKRIINKYDKEAKKKGVLIIPCCGIDSVPADLGVLYTLNLLPKRYKFTEVEIYSNVELVNEHPSHGTWSTLINSLSNKYSYFYAKKDKNEKSSGVKKKVKGTHYSNELKKYVIPFPTSDPLIVYTSSKLNNYEKEKAFTYGNFLIIPSIFSLITMHLWFLMIFLLIQCRCGMKLLVNFGPKQGEGPSEEERKKSSIKWIFVTKCKSKEGNQTIETSIKTKEAYTETGRIAGECAISLLEDILPKFNKENAGVKTPSSIFGADLIKRLKKIGIEFSINKSSFEKTKDDMELVNKYVYMK
eukprot:gene12686-6580_t